jgi:rhomboid protease GluP
MSDKPQKNSLLCPNCRKLISRSVPACPFCGMRHPASRWKNSLLLAGITDSDQLVKVLITVNVVMFGLSLLIDPRSSALSASPFQMLSPSSQSLFVLGSTGTVPLFHLDRWWTLIAAGFLHGGLLHLVFNMLALRQLAPLVCMEYGVSRTIAIYSLGNIVGFFLSGLAGVNFTIGASAAVCSLIGAMLYYGKSRGGIYGQMVFRQIGGWAIGIALFGFLVPGINNWGHGGGMLAGALLALLLGYRERRSEQFSHRVLAVLCIAVTALVLAWSCLNGLLFLLLR